MVYLQQCLLSRPDWTTLEELAGPLLVSRSTVSSNLQALARTFEKFGLVIERRSRYDIRVSGSEIDKRRCLASAVINAHLEADGLGDARSHSMLNAVGRCVDAILKRENYKVNPVLHQSLVTHLAIALALERAQTERAKKRVLVVCTTGVGARLLAYRPQRELNNGIGTVGTCDVSDFDDHRLDGVDCIFTTAPLARRTAIPVIHTSPFIDETSSADVKHALRRAAEALLHREQKGNHEDRYVLRPNPVWPEK